MASTSTNCFSTPSTLADADDVEENYYFIDTDDTVNDVNTVQLPVKIQANGKLVSLEKNSLVQFYVSNTEERDDSLTPHNYTNIENETRWSDSATKLLIAKYKEYRPSVEQRKIKTMKRMWEIIKKDLNDFNHCYTVQQVESKWKTLDRAFKNAMINNKKTGRARKRCAFESELAEILLPKKSVVPPCVTDETQTITDVELLEETGITPVPDDHSDVSSRSTTDILNTPTKSKIRNKEISLLAEALNRRTEVYMQTEEKNYEQRERLIKELERKNQLFENILLHLK